jgi:hypothetical protein
VNPTRAIGVAVAAAWTMAAASSIVGASGFSHSTCLPAPSRASTTCRWRGLAITTLTASMSSAAATACQLLSVRANPYRRAVSVASGWFKSATETRRISGRPAPNTDPARR